MSKELTDRLLSVLKRSVRGMAFDPTCNCYVCDGIRVLCLAYGREVPTERVDQVVF